MDTAPSEIRILLNLWLPVTLVGVGLLILMASNYYIRKNSVTSRRGDNWRPGGRTRATDPTMQFEFMTREELKELVLREKEHKAVEAITAMESSVSEPLADPDESESAGVRQKDPEPGQAVAGTPKTDVKAPVSQEAVLLAQLAMKEEESGEDEKPPGKPPPPKGYKSDGVIRGALSNELPDEYKGKSRRI